MNTYLLRGLLAAVLMSLPACGQPEPGQAGEVVSASVSAAASAIVERPTDLPTPTASPEPVAAPSESVVASFPTAQPTFVPTPVPSMQAAATTSDVPSQFDLTFKGTIDGALPIEMRLFRDADKLSGTYFYEQNRDANGAPQELYVSGMIGQDGVFELTETDIQGETGKFSGQLQRESGSNMLQVVGNWSDSQKGKQLPFTLTEHQHVIGGDLLLTTTIVSVRDESNRVTYTARYPQLEGGAGRGANFNQIIETMVRDELDSFKSLAGAYPPPSDLPETMGSFIDISYTLNEATDNLVSVFFRDFTYSAGAAHPNQVTFVLNYDLTSDKALNLEDLFQPGADYLAALSSYSVAELQKRDISSWTDGASPKLENFKSWTIEQQGLRITFDPYQVAAYAMGPQEVLIPYSELRGIINPQGPLAALVD